MDLSTSPLQWLHLWVEEAFGTRIPEFCRPDAETVPLSSPQLEHNAVVALRLIRETLAAAGLQTAPLSAVSLASGDAKQLAAVSEILSHISRIAGLGGARVAVDVTPSCSTTTSGLTP
eukprot:Hpha_TRINITY_DN14996_c1_g14::TRINITY_DN14996_c1_g14_i1::g.144590::m.144590